MADVEGYRGPQVCSELSPSSMRRSSGASYLRVWRAQAERDLRRVHRLLHDADQMIVELGQIELAPQCEGKLFERMRGVILRAKEASIDACLQTAAQRREQRGDE